MGPWARRDRGYSGDWCQARPLRSRYDNHLLNHLVTHVLAANRPFWEAHGPVIGLVGTAAGLLGIILAVTFFMVQKRRKRLDWRVLTYEQLLSSSNPPGLVLRHEGVALRRPFVLTIHFRNTGNVEILPQDFAQPVTIRLRRGSFIYARTLNAASGMARAPAATLLPDGKACELEPVLFNSSDWVEIQLLGDHDLDSYNETAATGVSHRVVTIPVEPQPEPEADLPVEVAAVIAGQTRPPQQYSSPESGRSWLGALAGGVVGIVIAVLASVLVDVL